MIIRPILLATALFAIAAAPAFAQSREDVITVPVLRANVTVASDIVRIGDVIDNAGSAAQIAIYRAPDLGTTGSLPTAQVLATLQAHQVIGVDTRDIKTIAVTRLSRMVQVKDLQQQIARALERPNTTETGVLSRLASQLPLQEKLAYADYVIDTAGTKEHTRHQTKMVFEDLRRLAS